MFDGRQDRAATLDREIADLPRACSSLECWSSYWMMKRKTKWSAMAISECREDTRMNVRTVVVVAAAELKEEELAADKLIELDDELAPSDEDDTSAEEEDDDEDVVVVVATGELVDEADGERLTELELEVEDPALLVDNELVVDGPAAELELTM